jgi:hypothetical protein
LDSNKIFEEVWKNLISNEEKLTETVQVVAAASFEEREREIEVVWTEK